MRRHERHEKLETRNDDRKGRETLDRGETRDRDKEREKQEKA